MMHLDNDGRMKNIWRRVVVPITAASLALIVLLAINTPVTSTEAAPNTTTVVHVAPSVVMTTTTAISIPVDLMIEDVNNLYGADVQITFDPALLAIQDADPARAGIQIGLGPLLTSGSYYAVLNIADNAAGTARLALTQLNPTLPVTGSGVLAHVAFKPTGSVGTSQIHFAKVDLSTRTGDPIPATTQDGAVSIQAVSIDLSKSTKLASAETVSPTSRLTYTLILTNSGESVASSVSLTDSIPLSTTYVPGTLNGSGAVYNPVQNQITWDGEVPAGGSITLSYSIIVEAIGFASIVNRAYVSINNTPDRILTAITQVTPSGNPLQRLYLPVLLRAF